VNVSTAPKASAIIIGNELLNGKVRDSNSQVLAQTLFDCGVVLKSIEVIPDHRQTIADTLRKHAESYDLVFTSGGIGPTHDDITYDAVAYAFGRQLAIHGLTVERYTEHYGHAPNQAQLKMALLPEGCEVLWTPGIWVPTVYIAPVYVLPGIPELFASMLAGLKSRFTYKPFERALVYSSHPESELAAPLEAIQARYPDVEIGSYPQRTDAGFRVMLSVEGSDTESVQLAASEIQKFA
jgi:molybdenum cofactor synthesis domain-containing protein